MDNAPETLMPEALTRTQAYALTATGIEFHEDISKEEWTELGRKLGEAGRSLGFLIGDWLNYGNGKGQWGDTYTEAMRITGLEYKTLRDYASVSRKIKLSLRNDNLAFELHKKIAPIKDESEQRKWLEVAERQAKKGKPMSSRRLAKSILLGRIAKESDMTLPANLKGRKNVHPYVNRLMTFWNKLKEDKWLETTDSFMLNAMLEDLQPVIEMYDEVKARLAEFDHVETFEERAERFERMSEEYEDEEDNN